MKIIPLSIATLLLSAPFGSVFAATSPQALRCHMIYCTSGGGEGEPCRAEDNYGFELSREPNGQTTYFLSSEINGRSRDLAFGLTCQFDREDPFSFSCVDEANRTCAWTDSERYKFKLHVNPNCSRNADLPYNEYYRINDLCSVE